MKSREKNQFFELENIIKVLKVVELKSCDVVARRRMFLTSFQYNNAFTNFPSQQS